MSVKAWLTGSPEALRDLAAILLPAGEVQVLQEGKQYYLAFHEIDSPPEDEKFYEAAARLLLRINGLGRVENQNFRPVALSDEYTTSDGRRHTVLRPAPAQIRVNVGRPTVTVARPDGTVVPDPQSPWPDRFAAAASNPDLAEALEVLGKPENVWWSDLYWVFEIITNAIGGRSKIYGELGWATKAQVDSFTASAQQVRHARSTAVPPRELSLTEAHDLVSTLVAKWAAMLAAKG